MDLTIAICTYNRADMLDETLSSLFACTLDPAWRFEVLIVDNASTDETPAVAHRHADKHPRFVKYLSEPRLGKVYALNTAIDKALGDAIAFVDDDLFFDIAWLREAFDFLHAYPEVSCFAGRINLHFERTVPTWLSPDPAWLNMRGMYSCTNLGDKPRMLEPDETPIGANVIFRKTVFLEIGGFNPALGRVGRNLLSKEESEHFHRFCQAGLKAIYAPSMIVQHRVTAERLRKRWMIRRFYWQGVSQVLHEQIIHPVSRKVQLVKAFGDMRDIIRIFLGNSLNPRKIWYQVRSYRFWHLAFAALKFGLISQRLKTAAKISRT